MKRNDFIRAQPFETARQMDLAEPYRNKWFHKNHPGQRLPWHAHGGSVQRFDDGGSVDDDQPLKWDDFVNAQPQQLPPDAPTASTYLPMPEADEPDPNANQPLKWDDFVNAQPQTSQIGAAVAGAAPAAAPITAAIAAGARTMAATSEFGPWVSIPAGLGAGFIASGVVGKIQDWLRDQYGPTTGPLSKEYEVAAAEQHPLAYQAGRVAPIAAGMAPGTGIMAGQRAISGALLGGADVVQQAITKSPSNIDWTEAGVQGAAGALLPNARPWASGRPDLETLAPGVGQEGPTPSGTQSGASVPKTSAQAGETPVGKQASSDGLAEQQAQGQQSAPFNTSPAKGVAAEQPPTTKLPQVDTNTPTAAATISVVQSNRQGLKPGVGAGKEGPGIVGAQSTAVDTQAIPQDVAAAIAPASQNVSAATPTSIVQPKNPSAQPAGPVAGPDIIPTSRPVPPPQIQTSTPPVPTPPETGLADATVPPQPTPPPTPVGPTPTGLEGQVTNAQQLIEHAFNTAVNRPIVRQPMPSIANSSKDLTGPVVVDPKIPDDYVQPLAVHETVEQELMSRGMPYAQAHAIATGAERDVAERTLGLNWDKYSSDIAKLAPEIEGQKVNPATWQKLDLHEDPMAAIGHHTDKDIMGDLRQDEATPGLEQGQPVVSTEPAPGGNEPNYDEIPDFLKRQPPAAQAAIGQSTGQPTTQAMLRRNMPQNLNQATASLRAAWDKMFNGSTAAGGGGKVPPPPIPEDLQHTPENPLSPDADATAQELGKELGNNFNLFKTTNQSQALKRRGIFMQGSQLADNNGWEIVADAYENKNVDQLPENLKPAGDLYGQIEDKIKTRYNQIRELDPDNTVGLPNWSETDEKGFVPRLRTTDRIENDSDDPIIQQLGTLSPAVQRRDYVALRDDDGKLAAIVKDKGDGTLHAWGAEKPTYDYEPVNKDKDSLADVGSRVKVDGKTYTVSNATVDELHNANIVDPSTGQPIRYIKNGLLRGIASLQSLDKTYSTLKLLDKIKPDVYNAGTTKVKVAEQNGWSQTILPQFATKGGQKLYLPDGVRWALDDYAHQGFQTPPQLDRLAGNLLKTLYVTGGYVHVLNEAALWAVGRGWDWVTPTGLRSIAQDVPKAIHAVLKAGDGDATYHEILEHGGNLMYGSVLTREAYQDFMRRAGMNMVQDSKVWRPIAAKFGWDVPQMAQAIYNRSAKMMWAPSDMLYVQRYLENKAKGMTPEQSIADTEKWISNYRIGTTLLGNRFAARLLATPGLSAFGRYHAGLWKSMVDMSYNLTVGTPEERKEAFGQLMVMGVIGLGLYPLLDQFAQKVTGNQGAEFGRRGPFTIPSVAGQIATGKKGYESLVPQIYTPSIPINTAVGLARNQDWTGKPIVTRADLTKPANIGRAGVQLSDYAGRSLVPPYSTLSNAIVQPGGNPLTAAAKFLEGAVGIKNPSKASSEYMSRINQENAKLAKARARHPAGLGEKLYNKLTGTQ